MIPAPTKPPGRRPIATPAEAYAILEARKVFSPEVTAAQFTAEMVAAGLLRKACCSASMHRLLTGQMFPRLHVHENGQPTARLYNYSEVPRAKPGQPLREGVREYETGEPRRPMTKIRRWLKEQTVLEVQSIINTQAIALKDEVREIVRQELEKFRILQKLVAQR
jgi:hypothetical protein